jgi:ectoine hydroxylase-related dioxygenase (phytanoyl-CoA dioxygenase family)
MTAGKVRISGMTDVERAQLDERGYVVLEHFMSPELTAALLARVEALFESEGENAGHEFRAEPFARRLANLVDKGEVFDHVWADERILEYVAHILGPDFKLSSLNARSANPYSPEPQPLHCDMGALPDARGYSVANTLWMLDDFTSDNGATRVVPGSHKSGKLPQLELPDPLASHPDEVLITGPAGTVVVYNAHLWHGGTANRTARHRRALHAFFVRRDLPQQQWQNRLLHDETKARMDARRRWLLALDDPDNDRLCESGSNRSGFMR